jgi:hypothetical protein
MSDSLKQERQTKKTEGSLNPDKQGEERAASDLNAGSRAIPSLFLYPVRIAALAESFHSITRANGLPAASVRVRTKLFPDLLCQFPLTWRLEAADRQLPIRYDRNSRFGTSNRPTRIDTFIDPRF